MREVAANRPFNLRYDSILDLNTALLYQTVELHHFIRALDVAHDFLGIKLSVVDLVNDTDRLATLIVPKLHFSEVGGCDEHVAGLRVLNNVDEVRLSLAE